MDPIKRREALKRVAWIMGGALSAPVVSGILNGCTATPELTWVPSFFTKDQAVLVTEVAETIIPETDTYGARTLGVPQFIEEMVNVCYNPADQSRFVEGMSAFKEQCKSSAGSEFISLSKEKRKAYLDTFNDKIKTGAVERMSPAEWFFKGIKELTVTGYFTTEYGASQLLQYQDIPVEYHGCVPLDQAGNGKAWATY